MINTFNFARQQEGGNVSLSIDPAAYDAASPQQQTLMLVNAERQDRGLGALQLDTTLISQIALNHSQEMAQYNYGAHESPINQSGGKNDPISRLAVNPAVMGHATCYRENMFVGASLSPAAGLSAMPSSGSCTKILPPSGDIATTFLAIAARPPSLWPP